MRICKMAVAAGLAVLMLGGCKRSGLAQNLGNTLENWRDGGGVSPVQNSARISDITPAPDASFSGALGFGAVSLPSSPGFSASRFFAIDGWIGQIEYEREEGGRIYLLVVRAARAGDVALPSLYPENHSEKRESITVDGIEVQRWTDREGCVLFSWTRGDFQYTVHSNKLQGMPREADITLLVEGLSCEEI